MQSHSLAWRRHHAQALTGQAIDHRDKARKVTLGLIAFVQPDGKRGDTGNRIGDKCRGLCLQAGHQRPHRLVGGAIVSGGNRR